MTMDKPVREEGRPSGDAEAVSPIEFYLDPTSGLPTYRQLLQQVDRALLLGHLRRGDQLPRVRDVTSSLAVNPDTVLKAYRELEHRGVAKGRPGQGTFIVAEPQAAGLAEIAGLRRSLVGWLEAAAAAGLDTPVMAALFTTVLHDFEAGAGTGAGTGAAVVA